MIHINVFRSHLVHVRGDCIFTNHAKFGYGNNFMRCELGFQYNRGIISVFYIDLVPKHRYSSNMIQFKVVHKAMHDGNYDT